MKVFRRKSKKRKKIISKKNKAKIFTPKTKKCIVITFKSIISLVIFIFLIIAVIFVFQSDYFKICQIDCQTENFPCMSEDKNLFAKALGNNIFLFETQKLTDSIKKDNPEIAELLLEKKLPHKIVVQIDRRQAFVCLDLNQEQWYIGDKKGVIFKKLDHCPHEMVKVFYKNGLEDIKLGEQIKDQGLKSVFSIIELIQDNLVGLKEIRVDAKQNLTLLLEQGIIASFSATKNSQAQVDSLHFILRLSKIEGNLPKVIDLRFDKPVIKF